MTRGSALSCAIRRDQLVLRVSAGRRVVERASCRPRATALCLLRRRLPTRGPRRRAPSRARARPPWRRSSARPRATRSRTPCAATALPSIDRSSAQSGSCQRRVVGHQLALRAVPAKRTTTMPPGSRRSRRPRRTPRARRRRRPERARTCGAVGARGRRGRRPVAPAAARLDALARCRGPPLGQLGRDLVEEAAGQRRSERCRTRAAARVGQVEVAHRAR